MANRLGFAASFISFILDSRVRQHTRLSLLDLILYMTILLVSVCVIKVSPRKLQSLSLLVRA